MLLSETIELPIDLILYAVAGIAFLIVGAAITYGLFYNRASYHHPVSHHQNSSGCGFIVAFCMLIILGVAAYVLLPKLAERNPQPEKEGKVQVVQAGVSPNTDSKTLTPTFDTDKDLSIFGPVDSYEYNASNNDELTPKTVSPPDLVQHAASSRQDWAESRAKKLRKQGYQNVTVEFNPDGGSHPWRILSQPVAFP